MPKPSNYIQDTNPFQLGGPPAWFLGQLWEFDNSLAILPSRQGFYYRLAQRRKLQLPEKVIHDVLKEQADTQMLASYGLVPVTTILATANWSNPYLFEELKRRAPWRMGGATKFTSMVEAQDKREELDKSAKNDDMLNQLSKDAWRYYNKKIGTRSHLYSPVTKNKTEKRAHGLALPSPLKGYQPVISTNWGNPNKP